MIAYWHQPVGEQLCLFRWLGSFDGDVVQVLPALVLEVPAGDVFANSLFASAAHCFSCFIEYVAGETLPQSSRVMIKAVSPTQ